MHQLIRLTIATTPIKAGNISRASLRKEPCFIRDPSAICHRQARHQLRYGFIMTAETMLTTTMAPRITGTICQVGHPKEHPNGADALPIVSISRHRLRAGNTTAAKAIADGNASTKIVVSSRAISNNQYQNWGNNQGGL